MYVGDFFHFIIFSLLQPFDWLHFWTSPLSVVGAQLNRFHYPPFDTPNDSSKTEQEKMTSCCHSSIHSSSVRKETRVSFPGWLRASRSVSETWVALGGTLSKEGFTTVGI